VGVFKKISLAGECYLAKFFCVEKQSKVRAHAKPGKPVTGFVLKIGSKPNERDSFSRDQYFGRAAWRHEPNRP
jgi:hypothetical protein